MDPYVPHRSAEGQPVARSGGKFGGRQEAEHLGGRELIIDVAKQVEVAVDLELDDEVAHRYAPGRISR